jgi:hypothetical protein
MALKRRAAFLVRHALATFPVVMLPLVMLPLVMLPLGGCGKSDTSSASGGKGDVAGWKFASGKRPSRAEYAALVASCRQGAVRSAQGKPLEPGQPLEVCLAELGLHRE